MAVMLETGHGKDGNPNHPYVREHPTNYDWREDIERLTHRIVNRDSFRGYIWINTYERHPPGGEDDFWRHRDTTSFDVGRSPLSTRSTGLSSTSLFRHSSKSRWLHAFDVDWNPIRKYKEATAP